jgi:hypothetical protein
MAFVKIVYPSKVVQCSTKVVWLFLQNGGTQLSDTISPWCNSVSIDPAKLSSSTVSELTNALLSVREYD